MKTTFFKDVRIIFDNLLIKYQYSKIIVISIKHN